MPEASSEPILMDAYAQQTMTKTSAMKIWTSYFYNVRFMKPYHIPISTAVSDPKWFHSFNGKNFIFVDKNNVINGLRCEDLHPDSTCHDLCSGRQTCIHEPTTCQFLEAYDAQIRNLDRSKILEKFSACATAAKKILKFNEDPEIVLLVHESPTNACSERAVLQKYFNCQEFKAK